MFSKKITSLFAFSLLCSFAAVAQKDTTKSQTINITSSYKPTLKEPSKIQFSGTQLAPPKSIPTLTYNIPKQNLFFAYSPISLRPLALDIDTSISLGSRYYVKAGFGNLSAPYLRAAASFGDGVTSLTTATVSYSAAKGKDILYQNYSQIGAKLATSYFTEKNEIFSSLEFRKNDWFKYGYDHNIFNFSKDQIKHAMQDGELQLGVKNTKINKAGIRYRPTLNVGYFTNKNIVNELSIVANVPVEKDFTENWGASVLLNADITQQKSLIALTNAKQNNNLFTLTPSINYKSEQLKLKAGITPSWNDGDFQLLPNFSAEAKLADQNFYITAGWVGRYIKNSYENLSTVNPFILPALAQNNTKETEYYGGIKAAIAKKFIFNAKAGLVKYRDAALYINDTSGVGRENNFLISNESKMRNFRVHTDISYVQENVFSLTGAVTLNAYNGLRNNARAWHTLPMEVTGAARWTPIKKLTLKSDLYLFSGTKYLLKGNTTRTNKGGTDLSFGASYDIKKNFALWMDVNNALNDKYERWNGYQVYGVNFMGGIIIRL